MMLECAYLNKAKDTCVHCLELQCGGVRTVGEPGLL